MDIEFTAQLIDSMDEAIIKLEKSIKKKEKDEAVKLKSFILDLQRQIADSLKEKNV